MISIPVSSAALFDFTRTKLTVSKIAFLSHFSIYFLLYKELLPGTHFRKGSRWSSILPGLATLDIGGTLLFIFGVGLIILGTAWGGSTYPWASAQVLAPIIVGGICFACFFAYEYLLEPGRVLARVFPRQVSMIPYSLFSRMDTLLIAILDFASGAGELLFTSDLWFCF